LIALKLKRSSSLPSGMQSQCGSGKENKMTVQFVEITLWTFVLNAKQTKKREELRNAMLLGAHATMHFISTAFQDG